MRQISEIIEEWKVEFGTIAEGDWGPYRYIDYKKNREYVMHLVQTLKDEGYTKEDLSTAMAQLAVVDACEAPRGKSKRKGSKIKVTKDMTAANWRNAILEVFPRKVSKYAMETRVSEGIGIDKEKPDADFEPELGPKTRIVVDLSTVKEPLWDVDFLAELEEANKDE